MDALAGYATDSDDDDDFGSSAAAAAAATLPFGDLTGGKGPAALAAVPTKVVKGKGASNAQSLSATTASSVVDVNLTPEVLVDDLLMAVPYQNPSAKTMNYNATYEAMYSAVQGPTKDSPFAGARQLQVALKNNPAGYVEADSLLNVAFEEQRKTFERFGYAYDPSASVAGSKRIVGDVGLANSQNGATVFNDFPEPENRKKRKAKGDVAEDPFTYEGPWAGYEGEKMHIYQDPAEAAAQAAEREAKRKLKYKTGEEIDEIDEDKPMFGPGVEKTVFHGKSERDYLGRTYMHVPADVDVNLTADPGSHECYLPKTLIHTWTGHTKGVSQIRFFPKSAHLLLSGSLDTKIKLWDVYHNRQCLRTYMGHSKPVKDITFNNSGSHFLSTSFDKYIKMWDTETGQCTGSFTNKRVPLCVKFNPNEDKQHIFIAGTQDKKIVQWDTRTNQIVQEYDQHLAAVNSLTFIDNNRRFVSTSDDKSIRVWDWDIPVVIKYIADPAMHAVPSATIHPSGKWWLGQSLDNHIVVYGAGEKFRINAKKAFRGHSVAGYSCQIGASPDGRFIMSGDASGKLFFWDWKTTKVLKHMKVHDQVVMGCEWHPHEPSKVATCSWDGTIKFWD